jgi:hypothetical protein
MSRAVLPYSEHLVSHRKYMKRAISMSARFLNAQAATCRWQRCLLTVSQRKVKHTRPCFLHLTRKSRAVLPYSRCLKANGEYMKRVSSTSTRSSNTYVGDSTSLHTVTIPFSLLLLSLMSCAVSPYSKYLISIGEYMRRVGSISTRSSNIYVGDSASST